MRTRAIGGVWGAVAMLALPIARPASIESQGVPVTGTVVGKDGRPLGLAQVVIFGEVKGGREGIPLVVPASGEFEVSLPPGRYWLLARSNGHVSWMQSLTLQKKKARHFRFELEPGTRSVTDSTGTFESEWVRMERDFFRMQRRNAGGVFITRDDIQHEHPMVLSDLTRLPWSSQALYDPSFARVGYQSARRATTVSGFNECAPWISVNGAPPTATYALSSFDPEDVEALEAFKNDIPFDFVFVPQRCGGLLVVWLKQ